MAIFHARVSKRFLGLVIFSGILGSSPGSALAVESELIPSAPYVESVDGSEGVQVERAGEKIRLLPGDLLEPGDVVTTGDQQACRIIFPNLAHLSLSKAGRLQYEGRFRGPPELFLSKGMIWAQVEKLSSRKPSSESDESTTPVPIADSQGVVPHRFLLRTSSAVMGVRGTEFVVEHDGENSHFSTMEGQVEVAKTSQDLRLGKEIQPVKAEERMSWGRQAGPTRSSFHLAEFRQHLQTNHPGLFRLRHQAFRVFSKLTSYRERIKKSEAEKTVRESETQPEDQSKSQRTRKAPRRRKSQSPVVVPSQ